MNIIDAKIINTNNELGFELYTDDLSSIELKDIHYPIEDKPYYEITVGISYNRLRLKNYYERETGYFKIRMNQKLNELTIIETDKVSLFAIKTEHERKETKKLVADWLITTNSFQEHINDLIMTNRMKNGDLIKNFQQTVKFLIKLQEIKPQEILNAKMEKEEAQPSCFVQ
ncbi:hypothetical protein ACQRXC_29300 (plasmid) [Niallia taxi]|uniref:hypothetical protein n=1 Tax=Niallia taxi TaxID=2499688 RepID=UPI003F600673